MKPDLLSFCIKHVVTCVLMKINTAHISSIEDIIYDIPETVLDKAVLDQVVSCIDVDALLELKD